MNTAQLFDFFANHFFISAAFVVVLVLLIGNEVTLRMRGFKSLVPSAAVRLINQENAQVLDVREPSAFNKGHVANALNAPISKLQQNIANVKADRDKPVIVVCENGQNSNRAAVLLKEAGFAQLSTLKGGIMAWRDDKLPLTKK